MKNLEAEIQTLKEQVFVLQKNVAELLTRTNWERGVPNFVQELRERVVALERSQGEHA